MEDSRIRSQQEIRDLNLTVNQSDLTGINRVLITNSKIQFFCVWNMFHIKSYVHKPASEFKRTESIQSMFSNHSKTKLGNRKLENSPVYVGKIAYW